MSDFEGDFQGWHRDLVPEMTGPPASSSQPMLGSGAAFENAPNQNLQQNCSGMQIQQQHHQQQNWVMQNMLAGTMMVPAGYISHPLAWRITVPGGEKHSAESTQTDITMTDMADTWFLMSEGSKTCMHRGGGQELNGCRHVPCDNWYSSKRCPYGKACRHCHLHHPVKKNISRHQRQQLQGEGLTLRFQGRGATGECIAEGRKRDPAKTMLLQGAMTGQNDERWRALLGQTDGIGLIQEASTASSTSLHGLARDNTAVACKAAGETTASSNSFESRQTLQVQDQEMYRRLVPPVDDYDQQHARTILMRELELTSDAREMLTSPLQAAFNHRGFVNPSWFFRLCHSIRRLCADCHR